MMKEMYTWREKYNMEEVGCAAFYLSLLSARSLTSARLFAFDRSVLRCPISLSKTSPITTSKEGVVFFLFEI